MARFDEIGIGEIRLLTEKGGMIADAEVTFRDGEGNGPEVTVRLSADVASTDTVASLQASLAAGAIRLLREAAELPDETVADRIRLGSRTYDERYPSED